MPDVVARPVQEYRDWIGRYMTTTGHYFQHHLHLSRLLARFPKRWIESIWTMCAKILYEPLRDLSKQISTYCNLTLLMAICWRASFHHCLIFALTSMVEIWSIECVFR